MKLQINDKGSWRDVAEFEAGAIDAVKEATVPLACILARPSFRISEPAAGRSPRVVAYLDGPFFRWRKP